MAAGHRGIEVSAAPRRQWHEHTERRLWEGPDEFRLLVDAERGILLSAVSLFRGRAIAGKEFVSLAFGEPLPPNDARLKDIGEVAALLYSAQRSFATARATVLEWREWREQSGGWRRRENRRRLVAVNPSRFRKEEIGDGGLPGHISAYNGDVWWHYSPARQTARTNTPVSGIPSGVNTQFSRHPITPGDDIYEILDAEYAICAEPCLNPSYFLYAWWLEPTGRTTWAGREAIRVRAEPNGNNGPRHWWERVESCELLVDAERGVLLRLAGIAEGREVIGHEVTGIEFDGPVDDGEFRFSPPDGAAVEMAWRSDTPLPPPPGAGPFGVLGEWRNGEPL